MTNESKELIVTRTCNRKAIVDEIKRRSAEAIEVTKEPLQDAGRKLVGYLLDLAIKKLRKSTN